MPYLIINYSSLLVKLNDYSKIFQGSHNSICIIVALSDCRVSKTKIYAAMMQEFPEKYGVIGFDRAGNPLEVMDNPIDGDRILVFHAMKLRESFKKHLGL